MTPPSGNSSLEAYAISLSQLEAAIAKRRVTADAVLNLLLARDEVQRSHFARGDRGSMPGQISFGREWAWG